MGLTHVTPSPDSQLSMPQRIRPDCLANPAQPHLKDRVSPPDLRAFPYAAECKSPPPATRSRLPATRSQAIARDASNSAGEVAQLPAAQRRPAARPAQQQPALVSAQAQEFSAPPMAATSHPSASVPTKASEKPKMAQQASAL